MPSDSGPPKGDQAQAQADAPGSVLRAVMTGVGIDVCASKLLGYAILAFYIQQVGAPGMTDEQLRDALQNTPPSFVLVLVESVLGALVSVIAGFACARIVQRDEWRVGALMAIISVLVGVMLDDGGAPDDLMALYIACDVACVMLGVKFGAERNRRIEALSAPPSDTSTP